jgi:UDP-N-acetylmuramate: L-alanyl-gamma-D-glutamyl-meso-diaminopimelate ligase
MPEILDFPENIHHIHIMGIGGTAMAALAGLLVAQGYKVTGSDGNVVYPPMSDVLTDIGITPMVGYNRENIIKDLPDLVIVGNVVRPVYDEAVYLVEESGLPYMSFPALLGARFLNQTKNIVIAGTHGKTTTTSLGAWLLEAAGQRPGFLIGGAALNFKTTARKAEGEHFIIEGDEYNTSFFDRGSPKFLHYRPHTAIITSVEFDHADIYRDLEHCQEAFTRLVQKMPADGCLIVRGDHTTVMECIVEPPCQVRRYGLNQEWDGQIDRIDTEKGTMHFSVLHKGRVWGQFESIMVGEHNLYNQVALAATLEFYGLTAEDLAKGFSSFLGIKRRQQILGNPSGITVVDDFAHHPTAIDLTLSGLKMKFGNRRLWAIFEPRSATSRRNTFQEQFPPAFRPADIVVLAPPFNQSGIPVEERLDADKLISDIRSQDQEAFLWGSAPEGVDDWSPADSAELIANAIVSNSQPGDVIAILSNGSFGGLHQKIMQKLQN